jgi:4-hydroxy-4-methyl-2-oxoglutarate aldolase
VKKFVLEPMPPALDQQYTDMLADIETATVGHFRHWGFMTPDIKPINHSRKIIGTAVTLSLPGQDSTLLHHTLTLLRPGDVLVIDRLGDQKHACLGGGVALGAVLAGAAGAIVDGMCTDPSELDELSFPVWARGISPITTRILNVGGQLNRPIACGGAVVCAGDIILADENGVLVVPRAEVAEVSKMALEKQSRGDKNGQRMRGGEKLGDLSGASRHILEQA